MLIIRMLILRHDNLVLVGYLFEEWETGKSL